MSKVCVLTREERKAYVSSMRKMQRTTRRLLTQTLKCGLFLKHLPEFTMCVEVFDCPDCKRTFKYDSEGGDSGANWMLLDEVVGERYCDECWDARRKNSAFSEAL